MGRGRLPLPSPLADFSRCSLDRLVDILRTCAELLRDMLLGFQLRLVDGVFNGGFTDNEKSAWLASIESPDPRDQLGACPATGGR